MMWRVTREELVLETWAALSREEYDVVEAVFTPGARWRAVEDGPWNCESRSQIISTLQENRAMGLDGDVEEVTEVANGAVVAFRPVGERGGQWPLDRGVRYLVLTFDDDERVSEMKGCRDRAAAFEYATRGER
jgi:hypothetical protein